MKIGDHVRYWSRRRGQRSVYILAVVREVSKDGDFCRVEIINPPCGVPIQTIETSRLVKQAEPEAEKPSRKEIPFERGSIIRHKQSGNSYVVVDNYGDHATAIRTVDVTNLSEWEKVSSSIPIDKLFEG